MVFDSSELPSLKGKVYFVTGANTGCGFEASKVLASKGATVVMAYRNPTKSKPSVDAVKEIAAANGGRVEEVVLDLASLDSVKAASESFADLGLDMHCLMNNAGVMMTKQMTTKDGFELQFGTNHLGHFALTGLLLPNLLATAKKTGEKSRIVNLTSSYHSKGPRKGILFDNLLWDPKKGDKYTPGVAYGHSKYANVLFTQELSTRLGPDSDILVNCVHPGFVDTELTRHVEKRTTKVIIRFFKWWNKALNVREGALTQLYVAASPEVAEKNYRGEYFAPIAKLTALDTTTPAITPENKAKLWEVSEELTGIKYNFS